MKRFFRKQIKKCKNSRSIIVDKNFEMKEVKKCYLCGNAFDSADQLILELKKDGYGDCSFCPVCGRYLKNGKVD